MICPGVLQNQAQGMMTKQFLADAAGHSRGSASSRTSLGCQDFPVARPATYSPGAGKISVFTKEVFFIHLSHQEIPLAH